MCKRPDGTYAHPVSACQKAFDKLVDGGASSPARCRASNFQFEPRQFRPQGETAESCGFCASCHPHHNLLEFSAKTLAANCARKRFLLWEMGFPDAKISTRSRRARRFCRFPKSSKSVGLGRLENPLGFQPSRRQRFICERAAALSRSPGDWVSGMSCGTFLRGVVVFDTLPGNDFFARGLRPSRALPWGFGRSEIPSKYRRDFFMRSSHGRIKRMLY